jgi:hypothetical protein
MDTIEVRAKALEIAALILGPTKKLPVPIEKQIGPSTKFVEGPSELKEIFTMYRFLATLIEEDIYEAGECQK